MDWQDIELRAQEQVEQIVHHLFPNGKREGAEWCVGSLAGEAGTSLRINLSGKVGMWSDFAAGEGGKSLCSLWMKAKNLAKFGQAVSEVKQFLGIADDFQKRVRSYPKPADAAELPDDSKWKAVAKTWTACQPISADGPVAQYLVTKRCIDPAVLSDYDVREMVSRSAWVMVFPYYATPGDDEGRALVNLEVLGEAMKPDWLKFERLDRPNGKKQEWTSKEPDKSLFGAHLSGVPKYAKCRELLICEGEKDALTWATLGAAEWGVLPVSLPFGAKWKGQEKDRPSPNREWLDNSWDWLQNFETVYISTDSDEAGKRAAADIIHEIGPRRCRLVQLPENPVTGKPFKDANEALLGGVPAAEMRYTLQHSRDFAPEQIIAMADREEEFLTWLFDRELDPGFELPFEFPMRIRLGEMTIWTGIEGSGKSTLADFVLVGLVAQGERALVASFEVPWHHTCEKLSRQALGGLLFDKRMVKRCQNEEELKNYKEQARETARDAYRFLSSKVWIYDHVGIGRWRQLIDDIRWARRRYGITQFLIDNFMRLGISKDDYAQQADAITAFAAVAIELNIHIHMVVHQNKGEGKKESSGKRSVSGAFEIIANAQNIVEVARDVQKGARVAELFEKFKVGIIQNQAEFNPEMETLDQQPDGSFTLHKQRNGDVQDGRKYLWFLWEAQQYCDTPKGHEKYGALRFVADAKRREEKRKPAITEGDMF